MKYVQCVEDGCNLATFAMCCARHFIPKPEGMTDDGYAKAELARLQELGYISRYAEYADWYENEMAAYNSEMMRRTRIARMKQAVLGWGGNAELRQFMLDELASAAGPELDIPVDCGVTNWYNRTVEAMRKRIALEAAAAAARNKHIVWAESWLALIRKEVGE